MAAVDMAKSGHSPQNIAKAIAEASPALQQRKAVRAAQQQTNAQTPTNQRDQDTEKDLER